MGIGPAVGNLQRKQGSSATAEAESVTVGGIFSAESGPASPTPGFYQQCGFSGKMQNPSLVVLEALLQFLLFLGTLGNFHFRRSHLAVSSSQLLKNLGSLAVIYFIFPLIWPMK